MEIKEVSDENRIEPLWDLIKWNHDLDISEIEKLILEWNLTTQERTALIQLLNKQNWKRNSL